MGWRMSRARRAIGSIGWFGRRRRPQPARLIRHPVRPTACGRVNAQHQRRLKAIRCIGSLGARFIVIGTPTASNRHEC
jgi:hypothetical protein